jgi:hypothetical protein
MTIRISAVIVLQNPQTNESPDFSVTTSQALARTRENSVQEFFLKIFYAKRFSDNNVVNNTYNHNEVLQISGNLIEVVKDVIHVTVLQANSFGIIANNNSFNMPSHTIQLNIIGTIKTSLIDRPKSQRTTFEITATQWVPIFPRNSDVDKPKGKNIEFQFVVHHPIGHNIINKTKRFNQRQTANIIGLLEIVDHTLFVQLSDIDWVVGSSGQQSTSSPISVTNQPSYWNREDQNPPPISQTRTLAADIASGDTNKPVASTNLADTITAEGHKRKHHESAVQSSTEDTQMPDVEKILTATSNDNTTSIIDNDDKPAKRTRSRGKTTLAPFFSSPKVTMLGGIPQQTNPPKNPDQTRITKLRNHATNLLPKRPFSFT